MRIPLKHPDSESLLHHFSEALEWQKQVEAGSRLARGFGYEVEWNEIRHRQLGRNHIAVSVTIPTEEDALRLIEKGEDARLFHRLAALSLERFPLLREWILRRPLKVLEHALEWEVVLAVVAWFRENPRSGLFMRQVDIPGVGTKFLESRTGLFRELLDSLLAESPQATVTPLFSIDERFGLRTKPSLVRFRILDESQSIQDFTDISAPLEQIAMKPIPADHIFITENEINGLAFPRLPRSIVLFGLGYGLESLAGIPWLADKRIYYWGDIDTHGFVMLDRLRRFLPAARSLLMDRETLMAHRDQWVEEPVPAKKALDRLTGMENGVFQDLLSDRFGTRVRLEQERIGFGHVTKALMKALNE